MTVTVPQPWGEFLLRETKARGLAEPSQLVVEALQEYQRHHQADAADSADSGACPPELKASLLEAINGSHHPLPEDYFARVRAKLRELSPA